MEKTAITGDGMLTIDSTISLLGGFHLFQWLVVASLSIMSPPRVYQVIFMVFGGQNPPWRCVSNSSICLLNGTFPSSNNERCEMSRTDWEYTVPKDFSVSTEFDLVCDREWLEHLMNSLVFVGWGMGAVILGWVADNYGRKIVIYPSQLMLLVCGLIFSFVKSVPVLVMLRFIIGVFVPAGTVQSFVLISEYVSSKHRPVASLLLFVSFTCGGSLFCLKAYYIQSWRMLSIVCTAPYILTVLSYFFVPESIRWIRLKGKEDQLMDTLRRIAYWNKRKLPTELTIEPPNKDISTRKYSVVDIFRTRVSAVRSIILGYAWLVNGMVFYSFIFAAGNLGGSIYLNVFLLGICGVPGNMMTMFLCHKIGRKKTVILSLFFSGICCLIVAFIPQGDEDRVIRVTFALLGRLCIGISFSGIYVWSVELYPTTTRSNAMGYLQVTSRIGAASAPWVARSLLSLHTAAPYIVMGATGIIASLLSLYLPSTKDKALDETDPNAPNETGPDLRLLVEKESV